MYIYSFTYLHYLKLIAYRKRIGYSFSIFLDEIIAIVIVHIIKHFNVFISSSFCFVPLSVPVSDKCLDLGGLRHWL